MLLWTMAAHQYHMMFAWLDRNQDKVAGSLENALCLAVSEEWTGAIEALHHVRKIPIDVIMSAQGNLLHHAVESKAYQSMDTLLKVGVNPNHQDWEGNTALHIALKRRRHRAANKLIKATDTNLTNRWGETPLHMALKNGLPLISVRRMIERSTPDLWTRQETAGGDNVLLRAVRDYTHPEALTPMMARGASVALHLPNTRGETAHDWLQRRARYRRCADEGMAVHEQQVLRATLDDTTSNDPASSAPIPAHPLAPVRRRM